MKIHRTNIEMLKRMGYEVNFNRELDEYFIVLGGDLYNHGVRVTYDDLNRINIVERIVYVINELIKGDYLNG